MRGLKPLAVVGFALVLAVPTVALAQGSAADIFKAKCAMCHGPEGSASNAMAKVMGLKPLSGPEVQKMSAADLTALINDGKGKMPAYKGKLSEADISAVAAYVRHITTDVMKHQQDVNPYPYRGPQNLEIVRISTIDRNTLTYWTTDPNKTYQKEVSDKVRFCKAEGGGKSSVRVSDSGYLSTSIETKQFVTLRLSRNLKKVEVIWNFMPEGRQYNATIYLPGNSFPTFESGVEYNFPAVCK